MYTKKYYQLLKTNFILLIALVITSITALYVYEKIQTDKHIDLTNARELRTINNVLGRHEIDYVKINSKYLSYGRDVSGDHTIKRLSDGWPYEYKDGDKLVDKADYYEAEYLPSDARTGGYVKIAKDKIVIARFFRPEYKAFGKLITGSERLDTHTYPLKDGLFKELESSVFSIDPNDGMTKMPLQSSNKGIIFYYHFEPGYGLPRDILSYEINGNKYQLFLKD